MYTYTNINDGISKYVDSFNIVLADKDAETFRRVKNLYEKFKFINLNSSFAVNFILEYERIDLVILSRKISNLSDILSRASRKKIKVYILGKDISYPINKKEVENLILKEIEKKLDKKSKLSSFKEHIINLLNSNNKRKSKLIYPNKSGKSAIEKFVGLEKENDLSYEKKEFGINDSKIGATKEDKIKSKQDDDSYLFNKKNTVVKFPGNIDIEESESSEVKRIKTIKQKIIAVSRAKGGVGSTTISIFLGFMFNKVKTLLVDLNFCEGGGDISFYLDIPKSPNILNFIEGYSRDSLENSIVKIRENLDVLQAPPTYEMSKKIDLQDIYCLSDIAKKKYHLIIFDLPNKFDDLLLGVIDLVDLLVMVSDNTPGSLGRLVKMNNNFVYEDVEKLLIMNKCNVADGSNLLKQNIGQFLNLKESVLIGEDGILKGKSDYSKFVFNNVKSFNRLNEKIFELLTYD
jgi:MinD-like ATPase involved in chromosome partitioning or flagellar assembly